MLLRSIGPIILSAMVCMSAVAATPSKPAIDADRAQAEAAHFLQELIRIDTSNPPGNESRVAAYLQGILRGDGIDSEILELVPGRGSLVARLKGDGSRRPLLLLGHEDVVPVDRAGWSVEPFAGIERDGVIWGRGAWDDKGAIAANLEVFLQLKRQHIRLKRDVIFLAEASEEAGSEADMQALSERYWDKIACEFALNEDGNSLIENGKIRYMAIGTSEKVPRGVRLEVKGPTGHASVPLADNAVVHLAAAVASAGTWETPTRLTETTRSFFHGLALIAPADEASWYNNVLDPDVQAHLRLQKPQYYSMVRTSVVPTILSAGLKSNIIPPLATATLDIRALPDEDMALFIKLLTDRIQDPQVTIVPVSTTRPATPASRTDTEMFHALEAAQREVAPEAITLPSMGTGATDSAYLRAKGVQAYGLDIPKTQDEILAKHGNDERVQVRQLGLFVRYLFRAVTLVAAK
jgi:acetylornithine deacetylase/succinyl-diaminopimelate desuccinylase-like protein